MIKERTIILKVGKEIIKIKNCKQCPHFSAGFLSEPNECGYFLDVLKDSERYFTPKEGIPEWCKL